VNDRFEDRVNRAFARDTHRESLQTFKVHCLDSRNRRQKSYGGPTSRK
jgi:hypothetical protein